MVTVLGLYSHVYLMLECFVIYTIVFTWLLINDRKKLPGFIIVSVSTAALYLPWALIVVKQAADVAKEFWIPLPTQWWVLRGLLFMPFQHEFDSSLPLGLLYAACVVVASLTFFGILNALKNKNSTGRFFFLCLAISILTIVGAIIITYQIK